MRFLDEEDDDPITAVVNLIDLFVVIIAVLLVVLVQNPLNPFNARDLMVIENPGKADMRIAIEVDRSQEGEQPQHDETQHDQTTATLKPPKS